MKNANVGQFTWKIVILWLEMQRRFKKTPDHCLRYLIFLATHYACPNFSISNILIFGNSLTVARILWKLKCRFFFLSEVQFRTQQWLVQLDFRCCGKNFTFFTLCHVILITFSTIFVVNCWKSPKSKCQHKW